MQAWATQPNHTIRPYSFPWLIWATIGYQLTCQREDGAMGINLLVALALPHRGRTVRHWRTGGSSVAR